MKKNNIKSGIGIATAVFCLTAFVSLSSASENFLKGNIHDVKASGLSPAKAFARTADMFRQTKKGGCFFTGYMFQSRFDIHQGDTHGQSGSFRVFKEGKKIKVKRPSFKHKGTSFQSEEGGGPAGVIFLQSSEGKRTEIIDLQLLDPDNTYDFADIPLYWLGKMNTTESVKFLDALFQQSDSGIQKEMIFLISAHEGTLPYTFLKNTASGDYPIKVRKNAVFWLGNYKDGRSLGLLKDIYTAESDAALRKHIVFALSLSRQEEAIKEIIRIARKDPNSSVRKQAVFWLGQKASRECIGALKEFVKNGKGMDIKKQAVFAISQLPSGKSVPLLIEIARTNKSPGVRKQAIFWLGQSNSDAALKFFEEILTKK